MTRILPVDQRVANTWAQIRAAAKDRGPTLSVIDSLIAATALVHDLVVVTRNVADFRHAGVKLHDPWTTV